MESRMDELNIGEVEEKPKSKQEMVITELITHMNSLEEKINTLNNNMSEIKDVQLVDKLDIINLKNEIENITSSAHTISPETQQTIEDVHELADDIKHIKKIKDMEKNINILKDQLEKSFLEIDNLKQINKDSRKKIIPPKTQKVSLKEGNKCKYCKTKIHKKSKFCTKCGKKV